MVLTFEYANLHCNVVLIFESVAEVLNGDHKILKRAHSNENIEHYFLVVLFIMLYEVAQTFQCVDENLLKKSNF